MQPTRRKVKTMKTIPFIFLIFVVAVSGCASRKKKTEMQMQRAYASGMQAARVQMQQAQQLQPPTGQPTIQPNSDPQVRILGPVRNPVVIWSEGLTLARALSTAEYLRNDTPVSITIYRNNQPLQIDPQRVLQGEDYPLFPGDLVYLQD